MTTELDPLFSFATLVGGPSNQLAVAAGRALAEAARPPFNPLFLVGGPGQGKTHLLVAIGNLRRSIDPGASIRYLDWGLLLEELRSAEAAGRVADFLAPLVRADLLLIDSLEGLHDSGPATARRELVGLLEERLTHRRAMALASTRGPGALLGPDDPLVRLLGGGLVVEVGPAEASLKEEIMRRRAADAGVSFARAVVEEVVRLPLDSIRDVVGAVSRLIAFQAVSPAPLAPSQARVLITGIPDDAVRDLTPGAVVAEVVERPAPEPARGAGEDGGEFGSFLSEVVAGISAQVERWRESVADAMLRWEAEGFHTARLHALLDQELPAQPERVVQRFEADVRALREIAAEVAELAPDLAAHEALRDPDQLAVAYQLRDQARGRGLAEHHPDESLRLEDLAEGPSNREAIRLARAAAAEPGRMANPLVVIGLTGTGKTHLLHGLGNALLTGGVAAVACLGAQTLAGEVEEAYRTGRLADWRRRYNWAGAFLMDDLHVLAGHGRAQEVLVDLLDHLRAEGCQTAFTSSVPLAELDSLAPQLLARLASGTMVELTPPDRDVRRDVVQNLLAATEAGDDPALIDYLAARPADSVRSVQVIVQRVLRAAESSGAPASLPLAREVLEVAARPPRGAAARPGILGPTMGGPRLREKLVETWPRTAERLIEEVR